MPKLVGMKMTAGSDCIYKSEMKTLLLFILITIFASFPSFAEVPVTKAFIKTTTTGKQLEFYWSKPEGSGPFPVLLLIHPEQDSPKIGGESFVKYGQLDYWTQKGFITVAISQPGYGGSEGSADFCGPQTQYATIDLIKYFQSMSEVNRNFFFVYGGSRGAVIASMVATKDIQLRGVILKSGVYDFKAWNSLRPWYDGIKLQMFWEIGWPTDEKLEQRSASYFSEKIKAPLLLIHGTKDDRAPIELARKFANKVNSSGGNAQMLEIDSEHVIPMPKVNEPMEQFINKLR